MLTGRIRRGFTLLATALEESNPPQASERRRNAILQHTAAILVDQSLHPQSSKILSTSRRDTSPDSQHNEVERQHRLCRYAKGAEGSEEYGRGCEEGQRCKIQERQKNQCGYIWDRQCAAFVVGLLDIYQSDVEAVPDEIGEVPRVYRRVEIEYSKFGVEDFDFGYAHRMLSRSTTNARCSFYNKTSYSGLETHILNSYTNSVVQVMYYVYPIRRLAKSHITLDCPREHCLLCEFGFVVRMLEDAKGINCQASNFCKTVGVLAQGVFFLSQPAFPSQLWPFLDKGLIELVDYGRMPAGTDYAQVIQSFHRFFVDHLVVEGDMTPSNPVIAPGLSPYPPPPLTQLVGVSAKTDTTCLSCRATRSKHNTTHILDMVYPRTVRFAHFQSHFTPLTPIHKTGTAEPSADFNSIIQDSLFREVTYKATCPFCRRVAVFESRRSLATKDLPPVLAVNTSVFDQENIKFWLDVKKRRFLTPSISLRGQINGVDDSETATYELRVRVRTAAGETLTKYAGTVSCCTGGHAAPPFPLGCYCERYSSVDIDVFV